MCIGTPLAVVDVVGEHRAWCEADGVRELLDLSLVGPQSVGTWVLGFHGAAREVMDEQAAAQARAARRALATVLAGGADVDAFFADLVNREPELPAHLQPSS